MSLRGSRVFGGEGVLVVAVGRGSFGVEDPILWGGWSLATVPGNLEGLELAAGKPARSRLGDQLSGWTYVGRGKPGVRARELGGVGASGW